MRGATVWEMVSVPVVAPDGWSRPEILAGMRELERISRGVDAARSRLIAGLGPIGRDSAAEIARKTGVSTRAARDQTRVADVVSKVEGAGEALGAGDVSGEHLRALGRVADSPDAAELLPLAAKQSPEQFAKTVNRFQLERDEAGVRERQQAARSVVFFDADHGCVGMRAVLTPLEGVELRNRLMQIADDAWRVAHPQRAATLGGHGGDPLHVRLADALMALVRGTARLSAKPAVIVTVNAETLDADLVGSGPIPVADVVSLIDRADLYAAVRDAHGAILKFGRSRRLASAMQRLAVILRDRQCVFPGCDCAYDRCEIHHVVDNDCGGPTDIDNLALLCRAHHRHLHLNALRLVRDGPRWIIVPATQQWEDTG